MSETAQPIEQFDIYEIDDDDEDETRIGEAELYGDYTLRLTGGTPEKADFLSDIFNRMNGKSEISLKAPPPPGAGEFDVGSTTVRRGEEGFLAALQEYLLTYYNLRLG